MGHSEKFVANVKNERARLRQPSSKTKKAFRLTEKRNKGDARALMKATSMVRSNTKYAVAIWGKLPRVALLGLKDLVSRHALSVAAGDLQLLNGRWYVTHAGLLRIAQRNHAAPE